MPEFFCLVASFEEQKQGKIKTTVKVKEKKRNAQVLLKRKLIGCCKQNKSTVRTL